MKSYLSGLLREVSVIGLMTTDEFLQLAGRLDELESFLRDQAQWARSVAHPADARAFETARRMTMDTHAHARLLVKQA